MRRKQSEKTEYIDDTSSLTLTDEGSAETEQVDPESSRLQSNCHHVTSSIAVLSREELISLQQKSCELCPDNEKSRWGCLHPSCASSFCGLKEFNHVCDHHKNNPGHNIFVHLRNNRLFCYNCEVEVDKDNNVVPLSEGFRRTLISLKRGRQRASSNSPQIKQSCSETIEMPVSEPKKEQSNYDRTRGPAFQYWSLHSRAYLKFLDDSYEDDFPKGLTGLNNLGNTCYFNAAIQVLSSCPPFSDFFRDKDDLRPYAVGEPVVSNQMAQLIQRLWSPDRESAISPKALLTRVRDMFPQFRGWNQQDAQELIRCLLELIHRELAQPVYPYEVEFLNSGSQRSARHSSTSSNDSEQFETADSGLSSDGESPSTSNDSRRDGQTCTEREKVRSKKYEPCFWRSIVTDVFDGTIESGVKCLTCQNVSTTTETFQDLSLPIPSREQLDKLSDDLDEEGNVKQKDSWSLWWSWLSSFSSLFVSPNTTLEDCLKAFFSPDRLVGDDMYSCEKCKKLRNGIKTCRIKRAPEVLSIHIKRFRHDSFSSAKVSTRLAFPLVDLDISEFCIEKEGTRYDLCGFVTHEGSGADSGHYLAYCRNESDGNWYEFDDATVTKLDSAYVLTKEAYVLFYQRQLPRLIQDVRAEAERMLSPEAAVKINHHSYISTEWLLKLSTFSKPGHITNYSFLCQHGHLLPRRAEHISTLSTPISSELADSLFSKFGGGPRVNKLHYCLVCHKRWKQLCDRKKSECQQFRALKEELEMADYSYNYMMSYLPKVAISRSWYQAWEKFLLDPIAEPPGPIDNSSIVVKLQDGTTRFKSKSSFHSLKRELYLLLQSFYGGDSEVFIMESPQPTDEKSLAQFLAAAEEAASKAKM
ncbi:unnamed protein product [Auanema sp. JU1783]|nr:unnamed protein product [Auanema sp. JU1783]